MNTDDIINELTCSLFYHHIVNGPISLICGYCICKNCIADHLVIDCKICGEQTYRSDLRIKRESNPIKKIIHSFLAELFNDLEKRATRGISEGRCCTFIRY